MDHRWLMVIGVAITLVGSASAGQGTVAVSEADSFLGTWVIAMTVPKGAQETIRVWDNAGRVAASAQAQQFPPIVASDIAKMGKYLVLNVGRFENGKPIQAIIILAREGEDMTMIQELEGSTVTKRGSGKRQQ